MNINKKRLMKKRDFSSNRVRSYPPSLELEPIHQNIILKFDIEKEEIIGSVGTIVKANVKKANKIKLDAVDFDIHNVKGADYWDYNGKEITICWNQSFEKGEKREIIVEYRVEKPVAGLYFSSPDQQYPERPTYVVADHETERARYWLPCIDHISVRCSIDFFLTSLKEHEILANGKLIEEKLTDDGTKTAHWKQGFPCPAYLLTIAIGEFIKYEDEPTDAGQGKIPVAYYTTKQYTPENLKLAFDRTPQMMEWMWNKFKVPIEWDKYYQIATAKHSGAMENISFVTWNDFAILDETKHKEMWWIVDAINVHEMAHSYFGDMIVCKEFSHTWLKESWAVYVETLYYEDTRGENEMLYNLYIDAKRYMNESDTRYARPIITNRYDSSWDMYDSHLYPGGAWRIHMLRKIISDDLFFPAVIDYLQTFKGKTVETIDFRRKLEEHSGLNLEDFFEQWLFSPGYPKLKAKFEYDEKKKLCSIKIEQTQEDKEKNIGLFKFPLDIMWEKEEGIFSQETFQVEDKNHTFYFKSDRKPKQIRLDPEYKVLFSLEFNPSDEMLIHQIENSTAIGKILAAQELAKKGKKKNILAIAKAYENETHWGIKIEYAKALAGAPNYEAVQTLIKLLETETDPLVLDSLILTMEGLQYDIIIEAVEKYLSREEVLYYASIGALKVIGSQRTEKAFEYLAKYEIRKDFQEIVLSGLNLAIGKTRTKQAYEYLLPKVTYGITPEKTRAATIRSLGETIQWLEKAEKERAIEVLITELKRERDERLVTTILYEFAKLKEISAISAIELAKVKIAHQNHPKVDRWIDEIREGKTTEEETKKLRKEVKDLRLEMKKLFARIEEIEVNLKDEEEK